MCKLTNIDDDIKDDEWHHSFLLHANNTSSSRGDVCDPPTQLVSEASPKARAANIPDKVQDDDANVRNDQAEGVEYV